MSFNYDRLSRPTPCESLASVQLNTTSEEVNCELIEVPPDFSEPYEALSWCWGREERTKNLRIHQGNSLCSLSRRTLNKLWKPWGKEDSCDYFGWMLCLYSYRTSTKHLETLRFTPQFVERYDFLRSLHSNPVYSHHPITWSLLRQYWLQERILPPVTLPDQQSMSAFLREDLFGFWITYHYDVFPPRIRTQSTRTNPFLVSIRSSASAYQFPACIVLQLVPIRTIEFGVIRKLASTYLSPACPIPTIVY